MLLIDLLTLPIAALWQQKMRTVLTTLGVVFGAFVLAASLSIGEGVQETIDRESHRSEVSRRINVYPNWVPINAAAAPAKVKVDGDMSDARRERIRQAFAEMQQQATIIRLELTRERLDQLAALANVDRVIPLVYNNGLAVLGKKTVHVQIVSARSDDEACRRRIVAGRFFADAREHAVVVSEFLAYRLGLVNDTDVQAAIGRPLRLDVHYQRANPGFGISTLRPPGGFSREARAALGKLTSGLPGALEKRGLAKQPAELLRAALRAGTNVLPENFREEFTLVGVVRRPTNEERMANRDPLSVDSDVLLPYQTALDVFFRGVEPGELGELGVNMAVVLVDSEKNVRDVVERVAKMGLQPRAPLEFIERERMIYVLIFGGMTCVAGVALLVSALGIANTMLMSVLERTREIGIMKAVGANNRHLQFIFLVEGALIGLFGAAAGLLLAWAASYPGDAWVRSMVRRDIKFNITSSIFVFPPWMAATVLIFTVTVTTLAALYPARHAARIDPVAALRHE